tara:strand:+ start:7748 stop:8578 length:831 start_codon:yes stop_codon:yes gene_type:complete
MSKKVSKASTASAEKECKNKRQALSQLKRLLKDSDLSFRSKNQEIFYKTLQQKDIIVSAGPAGTGKTYLAIYYALKELVSLDNHIDGIVITKPLVEAEGEKLGFLPGDISDKTDPFMMSYWYNMRKVLSLRILDVLVDTKVIEVIPLAYMRGLTMDNKIVILDEAQNATPAQIKMFLTRIGYQSKYIICGDVEQTDRKDINGLQDVLYRFADFEPFGQCMFSREDIVRHPLISSILNRYQDNYNVAGGGDGVALISEKVEPIYDISKQEKRTELGH